ncbi:ferrous iron transport protein A [Stenotrophomonas maltophilia]|uniref:FeoA family protein n=1 Tax=Stenotrophomonas TaxID=40323 RepID=UPI000C25D214|nr:MULTISPECIES: FeoA family protein [Stenotrophomonas]MBN5090209.1 ferrous iron transport protein A [Stenotrophomonas maltophilia]MCU1001220.1 ferrous iron transport protein A [Stenotrophomonas maltophilia]MCU1065686.1 ferrous iron transport protein A [Stenotrophomonas maltophilia]MCU1075082.1 ferrous iron transport protein A [Stenotrophomonas maltophilia]MCU1141525.1 ferrous iron transport protein A [Stenotrophomonas maltophilia]
MTLSELPLHTSAVVESVQDLHANDAIARRLRELGFVQGEEVRLVAKGPVGGEPLLVQVGFTRFALRISEAKRVVVDANRQERRA